MEATKSHISALLVNLVTSPANINSSSSNSILIEQIISDLYKCNTAMLLS